MKNLLRLLALLFVLSPHVAVAGAVPQTNARTVPKQPTWVQLTPEQQKILAPIEKDWDQLTDSQRRRFIATAKQYPKMTPAEQQRFQQRLPEWNQLSREERRLARERYLRFQHLSPRQREEIIRRWEKEHPPQTTQPTEQDQSPAPTPSEQAEPTKQ